MNNRKPHASTVMPLESWCFSGLDLALSGKKIDIGLLAESLLFYEEVIIIPGNQDFFALLIEYFYKNGNINLLYNLLEEGIITIYDHAFFTAPINKNGVFSLWNIQDPIQEKENTFMQRYLYTKEIEKIIPRSNHRKQLYSNIEGHYIESKASDFSQEIENAREEFQVAKINEIVIQSLVNDIYKIHKLGKPPNIQVKITARGNDLTDITWNTDFNELNKITGYKLGIHLGTPFAAIANANKLIGTAIKTGSDLYLPSPMSQLVGNKLQESLLRLAKPQGITDILKDRVGFPDIRNLVNSGQLDFHDIIKVRKEAKKFRVWLQEEGEKDRDAIFAYQNEVIQSVGLEKYSKKAYNIFGVWGGGSLVGSLATTQFQDPLIGAGLGSIAGGFIDYLGKKLDKEWRPIIFGNWTNNYIQSKVNK